MDSRGSLFRRPEAVEDPAKDLAVATDDFSVKVSSSLDKRFWVRLERDVERGALVVTDFTPGDRSIAELEAGVLLAVREIGDDRFHTVIFRDLVPAGDQSEGFPAKVVMAADLAKQLGVAIGDDRGLSVAGFDLRPRRGKIDAVIAFGARG